MNIRTEWQVLKAKLAKFSRLEKHTGIFGYFRMSDGNIVIAKSREEYIRLVANPDAHLIQSFVKG